MAYERHGESGTKLHILWGGMKHRCSPNTKEDGYRGVTVCEEWNSYTAFRDWARQNGYEDGLVLDRKDPNKGYCPENCRWITRSQNAAWVTGYWRERAFKAEAELQRWQ